MCHWISSYLSWWGERRIVTEFLLTALVFLFVDLESWSLWSRTEYTIDKILQAKLLLTMSIKFIIQDTWHYKSCIFWWSYLVLMILYCNILMVIVVILFIFPPTLVQVWICRVRENLVACYKWVSPEDNPALHIIYWSFLQYLLNNIIMMIYSNIQQSSKYKIKV